MRESYNEGLASHIGPESCASACKGGGEALTGVRAGRVWSREILFNFRVLTLWDRWKATLGGSIARDLFRPCAVVDPEHVRKHSTREPGGPVSTFRREGSGGCIGKSEDPSR
jgi:hypothetical protein